jgi:tetraacyldisaccharide 4'-kinase
VTVRERLEAGAQRVWAARTPRERALRAALVPAAAAYGAAVAVRNHLYDAGWLTARRVPARVVSVGNLSVGGTGKTPAALWLAERLRARGIRTGIVARGYGKRRRGVVVVSEGGRPLVPPEDGGDEAVMLARRFPGPIVTAENRADAAALACSRFGLDCVVLDDGFQHRALARDADLVLATAEAVSAWLLPAGPLREGPGALGRAQALLAVDGSPPAAAVPTFRGTLRPTALVRAGAEAWIEEPLGRLDGRTVTAVAGVAAPERLAATLERMGARVRQLLPFPDHHPYGPVDAVRIATAAAGDLIVTTEKDLVKLATFPSLAAVRGLRVVLEVEDGDRLVDLLVPAVDLQAD